MHSRVSSSVKPVMEACWCFGCRMEKGLLGSRRRDKNAVIALMSPASCPLGFPLHRHRNKQDRGLRPWGAALRSAMSSSEFSSTPKTGRLYRAETDESGERSYRQGGRGGVKGHCTHSEPVPDPLTKRDVNRNTNKYRHSHKAALWRSHSKILFSISCFSFLFIK